MKSHKLTQPSLPTKPISPYDTLRALAPDSTINAEAIHLALKHGDPEIKGFIVEAVLRYGPLRDIAETILNQADDGINRMEWITRKAREVILQEGQ